jgi:hypothetical protein
MRHAAEQPEKDKLPVDFPVLEYNLKNRELLK